MINLLPPQYKQELKQEENFRLVLILGAIFSIFLISLILILFSIKIYTQGQVDALKFLAGIEEEKLKAGEVRELREKIIAASQTISELQSFYKNRSDATATLEKIFQIMPEQVYLTTLSLNQDTRVVLLSGFSPSREVLFTLRNKLREQEWLSEINFPPQNWIKQTDIDFEMTFKVSR